MYAIEQTFTTQRALAFRLVFGQSVHSVRCYRVKLGPHRLETGPHQVEEQRDTALGLLGAGFVLFWSVQGKVSRGKETQ